MTETPQQPPAAQPPAAAPPAKKDTTMGWLAHLLLLFTWFIGPLVIWQIKKDDDKYAAFHGKQAMCWSLAVTLLFIVAYFLIFLLALAFAPLALFGGCIVWLVAIGNLVYVIFGIIYTAQNKVFKYFLVADQFCKKEFAEAYPNAPAPAA